MSEKKLSFEEYAVAVGLWHLHQKAENERGRLEIALARHLGIENETDDYFHFTDALWEGFDPKEGLQKLGFSLIELEDLLMAEEQGDELR